MLKYDFSYLNPQWKGFKAQLNVTNIGDKYYVPACVTSLTYCALGASRTVLLSLKYSFNSQPLTTHVLK